MIERDRTARQIAGEVFAELDMDVTFVPTRSKAMKAADSGSYDLLVLNITEPFAESIEIISLFRMLYPGMAIIALTGIIDPLLRREIKYAGADILLKDPVSPRRFAESILLAESSSYLTI